MNNQTPGPVTPSFNGSDDTRLFAESVADSPRAVAKINMPVNRALESCSTAQLLAASYTAFDRAGRELGIDATELAESIDLAEVIRYALDYTQLHTPAHVTHNVGRPDQTAAARTTLAGLRALMAVR